MDSLSGYDAGTPKEKKRDMGTREAKDDAGRVAKAYEECTKRGLSEASVKIGSKVQWHSMMSPLHTQTYAQPHTHTHA